MFAIDSIKGILTAVGSPVPDEGSFPVAIAGDPSGKFLYVGNFGSGDISVYGVDSRTGAISPIGPLVPTGDGPLSVDVDSSGKYLYVANSRSNNISVFAIDPGRGTLSSAGPPTATGVAPSSVITITKVR